MPGRHVVVDADPGRTPGQVAHQQVRVLAVGPGDQVDAERLQRDVGEAGGPAPALTAGAVR